MGSKHVDTNDAHSQVIVTMSTLSALQVCRPKKRRGIRVVRGVATMLMAGRAQNETASMANTDMVEDFEDDQHEQEEVRMATAVEEHGVASALLLTREEAVKKLHSMGFLSASDDWLQGCFAVYDTNGDGVLNESVLPVSQTLH